MAASSSIDPETQNYWLTDSGATNHITADINNLSLCNDYNGNETVAVGNGQGLNISHIGNSKLSTSTHTFNLKNILQVPSISSNLLSVHK